MGVDRNNNNNNNNGTNNQHNNNNNSKSIDNNINNNNTMTVYLENRTLRLPHNAASTQNSITATMTTTAMISHDSVGHERVSRFTNDLNLSPSSSRDSSVTPTSGQDRNQLSDFIDTKTNGARTDEQRNFVRSSTAVGQQSQGITAKAKNLKLNTSKAFQQQQRNLQTTLITDVTNRQGGHQTSKHQAQQQHVSNPEYLAQLLKDKRLLLNFPTIFNHVNRILDNEINRVRVTLIHQNSIDHRIQLPEPEGELVTLTKKLFVPQKDYPDFNFVGRILGPRGMTAKQLEQDTGCKIMIRGKGSMRDKAKEDALFGKPNWEHLDEDLHVLVSVEDTQNRASLRLARAAENVQKLLVPSAEGEDSLKKLQLMELAIINGTYRELHKTNYQHQTHMVPMMAGMTFHQGAVSSQQICMSETPSILPPASQQPPPATPTLVTTPVLLTPRIAPFFPPPGTLTRSAMVNQGQQQQQFGSSLVFQIDPNYVAVHHSPFLEFALFGSGGAQQQQQQQQQQTPQPQ